MDPKLETFLQTTGWSKEDLIRQLAAGEKSKSANVNDTHHVTSTTSNKENSSKVTQHIISKENHKTTKGLDRDATIFDMDFNTRDVLPSQTIALPLDDVFLQINTTSSYLPPLNNTEISNQSNNSQSGVIDLDSDSDSLDPKDINIGTQVERGNIIDISTDSDESVKIVDSLYEPISDSDTASIPSQTKTTSVVRLLEKDIHISKHNANEQELRQLEKYLTSRLKEIDGINEDGSESSSNKKASLKKRRRHRSHSDNRYLKDRHRKIMKRSSRSRSPSRPSRTVIRITRSRSSSGSRRGLSPSHRRSRCGQVKNRDRSECNKRRDSNPNRSRANKSRSSSASREIIFINRKRTRSRSIEDDPAWLSKVGKTNERVRTNHVRSAHSPDTPSLNARQHVSPRTDIPLRASTSFKEATRLINSTSKKQASLAERLKLPNNLSTNKLHSLDSYIMFKNIVSEETPDTDSIIVTNQVTQKIQLKRRDLNIQTEETPKLSNTASEIVVDDDKISETTRKLPLSKNFIEVKDKNLSSEVSQLISSAGPTMITPTSTNVSASNITMSNNKPCQLHTDEVILYDDISNSPQELQISEHDTNGSANIKTENNNIEKCTSTVTSEKILNTENVTISEGTDNKDVFNQKTKGNTSNTFERDKFKIRILKNIVITEQLSNAAAKEATNTIVSQGSTSESSNSTSIARINDCVAINLPENSPKVIHNKLVRNLTLQELAVESLSDISSGELTDDVLDVKSKRNNKQDPDSPESDAIEKIPLPDISEAIEEIHLPHFSDISDDDTDPNKFEHSDYIDDTTKVNNYNSESSGIVKNTLEAAKSALSEKNVEKSVVLPLDASPEDCFYKVVSSLKTLHNDVDKYEVLPLEVSPEDCFNKVVCSLGTHDNNVEKCEILPLEISPEDCFNKVVCSLETELDSTDKRIDGNDVALYDESAKLNSIQTSQTLTIEDSSIELTDVNEIVVPKVIEDLSRENEDKIDSNMEVQHTPSSLCEQLMDTKESDTKLESDDDDVTVVTHQEPDLSISTALLEVPVELTTIDLTEEAYVEPANIEFESSISDSSDTSSSESIAEISEDILNDISNVPAIKIATFEDISDISNETEPTLIECQNKCDQTVDIPEPHNLSDKDNFKIRSDKAISLMTPIEKVFMGNCERIDNSPEMETEQPSEVSLSFDRRLDEIISVDESFEDESSVSDSDIVETQSSVDVLEICDEDKNTSSSPFKISECEKESVPKPLEVDNCKLVSEIQNAIAEDVSDEINTDQDEMDLQGDNEIITEISEKCQGDENILDPNLIKEVSLNETNATPILQIEPLTKVSDGQSDKAEEARAILESVERSTVVDKATTNLQPCKTDIDDTPSLDIEAILKKCIENQERALKEKAEKKDIPPIPVKRPPKNRRPDFSALRDTSMSTVKINLMLERLKYKTLLAAKNTMSHQTKNDDENDSTFKVPAPKSVKKEPISVQSAPCSSILNEKANVENTPKNALPKVNVTQGESIIVDKPFYDRNVNDDIRNKILKQLDKLKDQRKDFTFSTCIEPIEIPKLTRKKTFAKLPCRTTHQNDEEEISIVNESSESPIIWLTKTTDYKKVKGWKNKSIGVKTKKSAQIALTSLEDGLAIPSCSFHYPPPVADNVENFESDTTNEVEKVCTPPTEFKVMESVENGDPVEVIETAEIAETNAFSSSMLDEFLLDKSEVELKISYEVPALLMGPRILESDAFKDNSRRGDDKHDASVNNDVLVKDVYKPRTLAEKRRLLKLEVPKIIPLKITTQSVTNPPIIKQYINKPLEAIRNANKFLGKRTINDDVPNIGHNKRKDFASANVYWKGRKCVVPCRERKPIYFRVKVFSRFSQIDKSKEELSTSSNASAANSNRNIVPPKAILWSPEKVNQQPVLRCDTNRKPNISYRAGPMCKKPDLIMDRTKSWECVVKPLPKIFLEITAEYGKSLHPRALQFLYDEPYVDLSKDKVDFALAALQDSEPIKYKLPISYKNGQTQFTLRKKHEKEEPQPRTPPACGDISSEVKDVVEDLLNCLEIQSKQDTFIKDDPDLDNIETPKIVTKSPDKKDMKQNSVATKVAAINKRLRIALGRLQVKFIDINIDEDPNRACDKPYCKLGCVCSSLLGALSSKEHCRRIECVLGCICGYKPPVNTTVTLPAGSDLDLSSTVDKLQSEATKNLAKVEKEFTQTIVCTKNETYVLGDTADRKRRCTRAPKKYADFLKEKAVEESKQSKEEAPSMSQSEYILKTHGVDVTDCLIRIEKVDMYHIIPFCWNHEEYQCECLKEFLIARSEEKASNLAKQLETDANKQGSESDITAKFDAALKLNKTSGRRKARWTFNKKHLHTLNKLKALAEEDKQNKQNSVDNNTTAQLDENNDSAGTTSETLDETAGNSTESNVAKPDVQENHPPRSTSRRKQVLSTMVDISEQQNLQVRLRKLPVKVKPAEKVVQNTGIRDLVKFLLPTSNVRLQFLKMLGKGEQDKDEFRLLSFLVLSNRFHLNLFTVWYSPTAVTSKYILSMDNTRPAVDFINVREFPSDMKTDNYLIQWLIEGTIPATEVQDFLVILKVITNKRFDICGMCEKSKIEYTDEPSSPLLPPPSPVAAAKVVVTPTPTISTPKIPALPTMTYDINGASAHKRKILNIQMDKIPTISCIYPSVALTGQAGLMHASLPSVDAKYRWLKLSFASTFAVLNMTATNYCIPHSCLVELAEESKRSNTTMMFKNRDVRGKAMHQDFAIYCTPQYKKFFFIGPYHVNETLTCETLCYYKNMLVSTENFNKIHGNPLAPMGCWMKQLQMKVYIPRVTPVAGSPPMSILRPIMPKPGLSSPPQLVKISDFMAAKKGKPLVTATNQVISSPKTKLLIVNNAVVSTPTTSAALTTASTVDSPKPTAISSGVKTSNSTSSSTIGLAALEAALVCKTGSDAISLLGTDYRDAEFKDKDHKTLQYLVTNIPGFGYVRMYRCHKTNIMYLMWRFVKMFKTLVEVKKALTTLIENTVIIVPSTFKVSISVINVKPINLKLINSDYYFDTYIAGKFGVQLLSNVSANAMLNSLKLGEADVQYINERSAGMLLKKCYNIASTFLTKDDLAKIRNWKDMLAALRATIDSEVHMEIKLSEELKREQYKRLLLQNKLNDLTDSGDSECVIHVTPVKSTSEVIEISDDDDDDDDVAMPTLLPEIIVERRQSVYTPIVATGSSVQPDLTSERLCPIEMFPVESSSIIQHRVGIKNKTPDKLNTQQQRGVGMVTMAQNFTGAFKILPHNQNSVLITRIKNPPANTNTKPNDF